MRRKKPDPYYVPFASETHGYAYADMQAPRLYSAEDSVFAEDKPLSNLDDLCEWMDAGVLRSPWWEEAHGRLVKEYDIYPDLLVVGRPFDARNNIANITIDTGTGQAALYLPRWAWTKEVVLHELTHCATWFARSAHGKDYATQRLVAQTLFGRDAPLLRKAYDEFGVKYDAQAARMAIRRYR